MKGIAEIPIKFNVTTSNARTEGSGVFTTSINLSAGTEASGNLEEGKEVYWQISGITEDDLETGQLEGSRFITNGVLEIEHSLIEDNDSGESFSVSVFSDADRTQQIDNTETFTIADKAPPPAIWGNSLYSTVQGPLWTDAKNAANLIGGKLASINSAKENQFIRDKIKFIENLT